MKWLSRIAVVLSIFLLIFAIQALRLTSQQPAVENITRIAVDRTQASARLAAMLRIPTDSSKDSERFFRQQTTLMRSAWPTVYQHLSLIRLNEHSQLLGWRGSDPTLQPLLLLAHLDTVPADHQAWQQPPYSGAQICGDIWGRGALDDKGSAAAILESVSLLLAQGYTPRRSIIIAFGHDEEVGGEQGAATISQYLADAKIKPWMVLDEGGLVLHDAPFPISQPIALVGTKEKGYLSVKITASAHGGHSSMPPQQTAIFILAEALRRVQAAPFPAAIDGPAAQTFDWLSAEMRWPEKLLFANRWLFSPLIISSLEHSNGGNALIRTTIAPTMLNAGSKDNVLPETASAVINLRLHPRDSAESALSHLRLALADLSENKDKNSVTVEPLNDVDGKRSSDSDLNNPAFKVLTQSIRNNFPDALVAPYLMVATSDSRHYRPLSDRIYRFSPIRLHVDELSLIHGRNERISIDSYVEAIQFYAEFIRASGSSGVE